MLAAALMARFVLVVLRSSGFKAVEVVMALDSEGSEAALQKADGLLRRFFAHRAAEMDEALKKMKRLCKKVLPVAAIHGTQNPADIANFVPTISPHHGP